MVQNKDQIDVSIGVSDLKLVGDVLRKFPDSSFQMCLSEGQLQSKKWLIERLYSELPLRFDCVFVLAGWHGMLSYLMLSSRLFRIGKIRSFDKDPECELVADTLNRAWTMNDWQFKACTMNIHELNYRPASYSVTRANGTPCDLVDSPDLIINTSCEHIEEFRKWWGRIPSSCYVVLQSNNARSIPGHINCVDGLDEFIDMAPMSELIYSGVLESDLYRRFMLIGRR